MIERGEGEASRRAHRAPAFGLVLTLLLALAAAAVTASGCASDVSSDQVGAYLGSWQRVVGGEPDPQQLLVVTRQGDAVSAEFRQAQSGFGGPLAVEEGYLVCELPDGNGVLPDAEALQLSLDSDGQLVVDKVLADGTTEPVWVYDRAASATPGTEP